MSLASVGAAEVDLEVSNQNKIKAESDSVEESFNPESDGGEHHDLGSCQHDHGLSRQLML